METKYKGFSTKNYKKSKSFALTEMDLVNRDLLNHIFTRRGERLKMAEFGTGIPDATFEPLDDDVVRLVTDDLTTVFNFDPRVKLITLSVIPIYNENAILAVAELLYIELNLIDKMDVTIQFKA